MAVTFCTYLSRKIVNLLEPFKRITTQLILLNTTKIRTNLKIRKNLNEKKC